MHNFLPVLALVFNAFVWGVSWWPFRQLHGAGVHPLWATALVFTLAVVGLLLARPGVFTRTRAYPALWLLALSSGLTNVAFNWAVTVGDVVRVVLLFYLMPAWSVLLAWRVLGERPTRTAVLRLVMAFAGVVLVMVPADTSLQRLVGHLSGADLLALAGGFCFALTSVTLRRLHRVPSESRMLAMFGGGALMATASACTGLLVGFVTPVPALAMGWVVVALLLATAFLLSNYALQYGATRLAAGTTALIMLSEVVFASVSSVLLTDTALDARTVLGGSLIVSAALLATLRWPRKS
jgi:drug/metabolite transporter (DMT)-like permease